MKFKTEKELLKYTQNILGKTFKEIDSKHLFENESSRRDKGILGKVVETGFYKYTLNTECKADFEKIGIELKVSGYTNKNGKIKAKERLKLSQINYHKIIHEEYENSHLINKCQKLLIIWYEYKEEDKNNKENFKINYYQLYDLNNDYHVLKEDYDKIKQKVIEGKAHELSERNTTYLGAFTSSSTSLETTTQPNSNITPKPRAFSLKKRHISTILIELINEIHENNSTKYKSIEEYIQIKLNPYLGKTQIEIIKELIGRTYDDNLPNNIGDMITRRIIGREDDLTQEDDIFRKCKFHLKNLPINEDKTSERMTFKQLKLEEFKHEWEDSYWKDFFDETIFITILWEGEKHGHRTLKGLKRITFNDEELASFSKTYNLTKSTIEEKNLKLLPIPKSFNEQILEIAPKGSGKSKPYKNFLKQNQTEVSFALPTRYLNKKLKKIEIYTIDQ